MVPPPSSFQPCASVDCTSLRPEKLMMRPDARETDGIHVQLLVDQTPVAGDIDASIPTPYTFERMIIENGVKWISSKDLDPLKICAEYFRRKFPDIFLKPSTPTDIHSIYGLRFALVRKRFDAAIKSCTFVNTSGFSSRSIASLSRSSSRATSGRSV